MRRIVLCFLLTASLLAACALQPGSAVPEPALSPSPTFTAAPAPTPTMTEQEFLTQYAPRPSDERLIRGPVTITGVDLYALKSNPPQYRLTINGVLPSTCYVPRVMLHPADAENRITAEVYGLVEPDAVPNYEKPFSATVSLDEYPPGSYTIWVNETPAGELLLP